MGVPILQRLRILGKAAVGMFSSQSLGELQGMLDGAFYGQGLSLTDIRSSRGFLRSYGEMPWLRAVAGKISFSVASTDWQLYVMKEGRGSTRRVSSGPMVKSLQRMGKARERKQLIAKKKAVGEIEEITDHPFLDMLQYGNAVHTGLTVRKLIMLYIDLTGQCFMIKERNAVGAPVGLWPLPPHWVQSTPTPSNPRYLIQAGSWTRELADTEVLWMNDADPLDPYQRGVGHTQAVADELEIDTYASKMAKQVFFNRGKPDFIVAPKEGTMLKQDMTRLERFWTERVQGFWNVAKPLFLPKPVDVREFAHDFRNFEFTELRKYQRDVVMQVFGIPPEIMGVLTNSNRATIDASDYLMAKYVLVPRLEFLRAQLQERLIPEYDDRLILDYDSPVAEDHEFNLRAMQANPATVRVNEWRSMQGLDPLDDEKGGSVFLVGPNVTSVGELATVSTVPLGAGIEAPMQQNGLRHLTDEELELARKLAKKMYGNGR